MDSLGQTVTFPMLMEDDGTGVTPDSVVINDIAAAGQQSFVFSTPNLSDGSTLLSFALLPDNNALGGSSINANTTNIIIKQASDNSLTANTIFLDPAQMALLSSGAGQVVLTSSDAFLEDGQHNQESHQIFLQVESDPMGEEVKENEVGLEHHQQQQHNIITMESIQNNSNNAVTERRPVMPNRKRGPGRPRRDDSKIMPPSVKGVWYCRVCGKEFTKWPLLKKHLKSHSDDKPHRCSVCAASFNVAWNLKLHEATHVRPDTSPLNCPACSRTFSRIASLKAHIMLHEEDESLFCSQCGDEFSTQSQLDDHMHIHEDNVNNIMDPLTTGQILENTVWITDGNFETHFTSDPVAITQQQLPPSDLQQCKLCNALFKKGSQLREHMKEHSKVKASLSRRNHKRNIDRSSFTHKCKECSKGFQKPSQLVRHMRIHTGEKPYQCPNCDKAFNQKGSLQIHMTKHSGVKPFTCEFCSAGFRQRGNLRAHILRVHTIPVSGELTFRCCECPCVFRKLGSLNAHVSRVHGNSLHPKVKKKRVDEQGNEVTEDLEDEVSVVMRQLAELEEATRRLEENDNDISKTIQTTEVAKEVKTVDAPENPSGTADLQKESTVVSSNEQQTPPCAVDREEESSKDPKRKTSADILQQALEKSGLSEAKRKVTASTEQSPMVFDEEKSVPAEKASKDDDKENKGTKDASNVTKGSAMEMSQSCMLTLADKAHDGTVRRYNIKVRKAGGIRWHQCTYCVKEFKKPSDLVRHIRIHTHERPYKCYLCYRAFAVKSTLTVHLRIHSGLKSYQCQTCEKKFASQSSLKVHQRLHSGLKPFQCPYCNLRFRTTGHRKTHITSHFRVRSKIKKVKKAAEEENAVKRVVLQDPIVVQQINNEAPEGGSGEQIMDQQQPCLQGMPVEVIAGKVIPQGAIAQQLHENRPHRCTECSAAFKKLSHLKQHIRSHTGEKPFGCHSCNKSFVSKGVLRAHLKTHVPIMSPFRRPHECSECGRKFVAAGSLKRHILNSHENLRKNILKQTYLCPYCHSPSFNSMRACRKHIMSHSDELLAAQEQQQQQQQQQQEEGEVHERQQQQQQPPPQLEDMKETQEQQLHSQSLESNDKDKSFIIEHATDVPSLPIIPEESETEQLESGEVAVTAEEAVSGVIADANSSKNVVVTFLDFQPADGFTQQVDGTIEENGERDTSQAVATISLPETEPLTQESLRQIEQTLGTNMFGDAIDVNPNSGNSQGSSHVKDTTLDFETHTISFDPSVFSNITLPAAEALNLHQTLPMETLSTATEAEQTGEIIMKDEGDGQTRKKKVYKCSYCERVFKKFCHLKPHLRTHTGEKPFQCPICLRMFVTMGTLKAHLRTHTGEKSFGCNSCGAHFTTNGSLNRHLALHSEDNRPFQCERCPLNFCTVGQWRRHWRSHEASLLGTSGNLIDGSQETQVVGTAAAEGQVEEGQTQEQNQQQQQQTQQNAETNVVIQPYNKRSSLRRRGGNISSETSPGVIRLSEEENLRLAMQSPSQPHLTLSERVLIASAAERERVSEISDKERQLKLAPKLPHACTHCPKSFRKPSDLARHIRTHTGERPFACEKCGRRFTVKSTLDSHRLTHPPDGDGVGYHPKYPCHVCGCLFATKGSLKVHMRLHTGARPFKCPHCELRFRTSGHRKAHLLTHLRPQQHFIDGDTGVKGRRGAGRGRKGKAIALEVLRTMNTVLQEGNPNEGATEVEEHPTSTLVEDWSTLQANLGGAGTGFQLQLEGGGGLSLQLDEGLLRQIQQQTLNHEEDDAAAKESNEGDHNPSEVIEAAVTIGEEEVVVPEPLVFETGDVGSLFVPPLEVILNDTKRLVRSQNGTNEVVDMDEDIEGKAGQEGGNGDHVGEVWVSDEGHSVGLMENGSRVNLVIDGDFVIEEDGTLRHVVGGECVVLSTIRDDSDKEAGV